jgi:hypothetical protein
MKMYRALVLPALWAALAVDAWAQTPAPPATTPAPASAATPAANPQASKPLKTLSYNSGNNSSKGGRMDGTGGSRGGGVKLPSLYALSPRYTGLAARAQPSLFWYQAGPASTRFQLTILEPKKPKPLLQLAGEGADQPGIHRISLAKHHVSLAPGIVYQWTISFVPDRENRSQDVFASGTIQFVEPDAKLDSTLAGLDGVHKAALYAGKGYWYDALEVVTNEIDAAPNDKTLRLLRASLLDQVGLKEAAASDRK